MFYTVFIKYSFWENINTTSHDQRLGLRFQLSKREEIYDFEMHSSREFMTGKCNLKNTLSSYKLLQVNRFYAHIKKYMA